MPQFNERGARKILCLVRSQHLVYIAPIWSIEVVSGASRGHTPPSAGKVDYKQITPRCYASHRHPLQGPAARHAPHRRTRSSQSSLPRAEPAPSLRCLRLEHRDGPHRACWLRDCCCLRCPPRLRLARLQAALPGYRTQARSGAVRRGPRGAPAAVLYASGNVGQLSSQRFPGIGAPECVAAR